MSAIYKTIYGRRMPRKQRQTLNTDYCEGYSAIDEELGIAIFEIMGKRSTQEDRVAYGTLNNWNSLPSHDKRQILISTFDILQKQLQDVYPATGSTAIISIIEENHIVTASVGDSITYLVIFDGDGNLTTFERLNKNLHRPDPNTMEGRRVIKVASDNCLPLPYEDLPGVWRLGDGLSLSRAIGDKKSELYGLTHDPEINVSSYSLPPQGFGFVIMACDGLTEAMSETELKNFVGEHNNEKSEQLAKSLVLRALNLFDQHHGSEDNISVMIVTLGYTELTRVVTLFDGHNGSQISQALCDNFIGTLKYSIKTYL